MMAILALVVVIPGLVGWAVGGGVAGVLVGLGIGGLVVSGVLDG